MITKSNITVSNIANASKVELLCITYEMLLEQIKALSLSENKQERKPYIDKTKEILKMLVGNLDFEYELSKELFNIYVYVQGLLIKGRTKEEYEEAYKLIEKLYVAYKEIAEKEEDSKPVMQNAETIYAGFTYGKNDLNEMRLENPTRGYRA